MGNLFAEAKLKTALANDTYTDKKEIVSKAGYLLGVDKNIFDSGELLSEIYEELEKNQDARMVRNLCFLFTCIEHCYKQLQMQMVNRPQKPAFNGYDKGSNRSTAQGRA